MVWPDEWWNTLWKIPYLSVAYFFSVGETTEAGKISGDAEPPTCTAWV